MEQLPLLVKFSTNKMPLCAIEENKGIQYNPKTQTGIYSMGGPSTSCHKVTNGTQPKNEADRIMDDN
jgi:hypothetical protein